MSYQSWCVEVITDILQQHRPRTGAWDDIGYESPLKLLVTHFADVYWSPNGWGRSQDSRQVNMWWDFDRSHKDFRRFFGPLLLSQAAKTLINGDWERAGDLKATGGGRPGSKIHFEHITPKSCVFRKLVNLPIPARADDAKKMVKECLRYNKIVVITKAESQWLDGAGMVFEQADLALLNSLGIPEEEKERELQEAQAVLGMSPKDNGSALLRMCRIQRMNLEHGHRDGGFCYMGSQNPLPIEKWHEYFASYENVPFEIP